MASLATMFQDAVTDLGNFSTMWDPFSIIDAKGLDGHSVFSSILPRVIAFGAGLLVLFCLLRVIYMLTQAIAGRGGAVMGLAIEAVLAAALLVSYPDWVRLFPQIFTNLGRGIQSYGFADLGAQVSGALAQMGDERATDFRLWSGHAVELSIGSLMAAVFSTLSLVLLWVVAKLQAYLFTFWYLLGPIALPTLVFPPMRHVCRIWFSTLLGVSFMGVTGPLLFVILARSQWLPHAFAAGGALDAVTCLVFSLLVLVTLVSIPILSQSIWSGIEARVITSAFAASEGASKTASALQVAGGRAQEAYHSWQAGRAASREQGGKPSVPGKAGG